MIWIFMLMALLAGIAAPIQVAINARLGASIGHPLLAALTNFTVGALALLVFVVVTRVPAPPLTRLGALPPALWTGGLLGAFYVLAAIILAPRLGTALLLALIILGQLAMSLVIDHFGLFGIKVHRANVGRLVGLTLVAAGVLIFRRF